jgi:hypothetical protein
MISRNWKLISKGGLVGRALVGLLPIEPQIDDVPGSVTNGAVWASLTTKSLMIEASDGREVVANTRRALLNLWLTSSGIVSKECGWHEQDGNRWISLPLKRQIDVEARDGKDPTTGYPSYVPITETRGKAECARFLRAALAAVDQLLRQGAP